MKLVVLGSTGGIGKHVVEQALALGHDVTAIARRPEAVTAKHGNLEVIRGDVLAPTSFDQVLAGKDAVVSAIGVADRAPTTLYSQGIANIIRAMQTARVRRLLCVSATGLEPGPLVQRVFAKPILWAVLKEMYTDLVRMESEVRKCNLDWTIVRPPKLTDGPHTGHYRAAVNMHLPGCWTISRADLADYLITQLNDPASYCGLVETAY